jgi:DNA-binding beta-propeller fold protein YncE
MPIFQVDPDWPKLPNNWVLGTVSAIAIDKRDHVWILHRPRSVKQGQAAPAVVELDANGGFVRAWGGDSKEFEWPSNEHGITVDYKDNIWIGGNGVTDDMVLKFTIDGKFIKQFGARGKSTGNNDTRNFNRPADIAVYSKTNEMFIADGYGNRRLVVIDADTGAFKRMWGAFGRPPDSLPPAGAPGAARGRGARPVDTEGEGSPTLGNPVHAVKVSNDGLVYLADRTNRRIQVFTPDGKYITQVFVNRGKEPHASAAGLAFSPDPQQTFLYVADLGHNRLVVLNRKTLQPLYQFGGLGSKPGEFNQPHHLAVDSKGNLYTAEVNPGNRAQKFVFKGMSPVQPANALPPVQ